MRSGYSGAPDEAVETTFERSLAILRARAVIVREELKHSVFRHCIPLDSESYDSALSSDTSFTRSYD